MKKLTISLLTALLLYVSIPVEAIASPDPVRMQGTHKNVELEEASRLQSRLKEIESMDKSQLSRVEKRALRKEVRSIDKKLRQIGGGVYISVGTLLLIVILLLIFL